MKTIKIFLASSEELDNDRMAFGNLVRRLDDMYEKRGIRIKLFEWEDYDAAFNDRRKQDEYNDNVRKSDIFLALFHKKAGKFTIEEFDVASEEFKEHASPKVYTYCKDLQPGEEESPELAEFKRRLFDEMGHYWCRYNNRDSLQLQFVMQLQLVENRQIDGLKVENGTVTIDGLPVARMDHLQFAAANEDYLRMQTDLHELHEEIIEMQLKLEKKRRKLEKKKAQLEEDPDDGDCKEEYEEAKEEVDELIDKLQPKLNKYNKLKEDFEQYQQLLFDTAKRVAQLQGERITDRMRRAIEALNVGKVREANIILDEAEEDARKNLEDYKRSKEITEQKRQNVISSIDELLLKASSVMADASIKIEDRIAQAERIYAQAEEIAREVDYEQEKYIDLLFKYSGFLSDYAIYGKAMSILKRLVDLCENLYGLDNADTALSYKDLGVLFYRIGDYEQALKYSKKALYIEEIVLGVKHPRTATSYNNIGVSYCEIGDYKQSSEFYKKALEIREALYGTFHPITAASYHSIGELYRSIGNYEKGIDYLKKALEIRESVLGMKDLDTAASYNSIGVLYYDIGDFELAVKYCKKALETREEIIGTNHPDTANSFNSMGLVLTEMGDYECALDYFLKVVHILETKIGLQHDNIATAYNNIGLVYSYMGKTEYALCYYMKALELVEIILGKTHPRTVISYYNISLLYRDIGNYEKSLQYNRVLEISLLEAKTHNRNASLANCYKQKGITYRMMKDYEQSLDYCEKALPYYIQAFGEQHKEVAFSHKSIANALKCLHRYDEALEHYQKALEIQLTVCPADDENIQKTRAQIQEVEELMNKE